MINEKKTFLLVEDDPYDVVFVEEEFRRARGSAWLRVVYDGVEAMHTFSAAYTKLMTEVKRSPSLGAATSNGNGDFRITVPRADSVLLFAEEELEDQPFFFASKVVATKGQAEVRVILPMCNKRL